MQEIRNGKRYSHLKYTPYGENGDIGVRRPYNSSDDGYHNLRSLQLSVTVASSEGLRR